MTPTAVVMQVLRTARDARAVAAIVDGRDNVNGSVAMTVVALVEAVYHALIDLNEQAAGQEIDCNPTEATMGLCCAAQSLCRMASKLNGEISADGCLGLQHCMTLVADALEGLGVMAAPVATASLVIYEALG